MAGVKITDLTPLATAASDDLLYIVDVSDLTQSPEGTSKSIEVGAIARPYKVYSALMRQSGTDNPIAEVLENTLGFTPTWIRDAAGEYISSNSEWLTPASNRKVMTFISPIVYGDVKNFFRIAANTSSPYILLRTGNYVQSTGIYTGIDGILRDDDNFQWTSIEIRVYN
jgi:hypothetical protein